MYLVHQQHPALLSLRLQKCAGWFVKCAARMQLAFSWGAQIGWRGSGLLHGASQGRVVP
jgi:hypothetical protein